MDLTSNDELVLLDRLRNMSYIDDRIPEYVELKRRASVKTMETPLQAMEHINEQVRSLVWVQK